MSNKHKKRAKAAEKRVLKGPTQGSSNPASRVNETPLPIPNESTRPTRKWPAKVNALFVFLASIATIAALVFAVWTYRADQRAKKSTVEAQFSISPASGVTSWTGMLMLMNNGPATARHVSCSFLIANSQMRFGRPQLLGDSDAGANVESSFSQSTAGVSVKDLIPQRGASFLIPITVPEELGRKIFDDHVLSNKLEELPKQFVNDLSCGGDNVTIVDESLFKLPIRIEKP